jgi:hypothetical protein
LKDFSFLVSLVVWYDVLFEINGISKYMQSEIFDMCKSVELLEGCHEFLKVYEENGSHSGVSAATELASDVHVELKFQHVKRGRHMNHHFHCKAHDEPVLT